MIGKIRSHAQGRKDSARRKKELQKERNQQVKIEK